MGRPAGRHGRLQGSGCSSGSKPPRYRPVSHICPNRDRAAAVSGQPRAPAARPSIRAIRPSIRARGSLRSDCTARMPAMSARTSRNSGTAMETRSAEMATNRGRRTGRSSAWRFSLRPSALRNRYTPVRATRPGAGESLDGLPSTHRLVSKVSIFRQDAPRWTIWIRGYPRSNAHGPDARRLSPGGDRREGHLVRRFVSRCRSPGDSADSVGRRVAERAAGAQRASDCP